MVVSCIVDGRKVHMHIMPKYTIHPPFPTHYSSSSAHFKYFDCAHTGPNPHKTHTHIHTCMICNVLYDSIGKSRHAQTLLLLPLRRNISTEKPNKRKSLAAWLKSRTVVNFVLELPLPDVVVVISYVSYRCTLKRWL